MNESTHHAGESSQHHHELPHKKRAPYWKRAHHSWLFWTGVLLMFGAIMIYVFTDGFLNWLYP